MITPRNSERQWVVVSLLVGFRSAKARPFAERKATIRQGETLANRPLRMQLVLICLIAYLIGAVPFGYLIARWRGVDILKQGSGNIGATNVGRVLGKRFGLLVFVLDFLKGAGPTFAALWLSK